MPLITESFDSLPYVDAEPTAQARARANQLISSEVAPSASESLHPLLPPVIEPSFSPLVSAELERVAASKPLAAIDTSRYESIDSPENETETGSAAEQVERWKGTLRRAYTAHTHLSVRQANLYLLEKYGKEQWLFGNYQLEHELKAIEKELVETRDTIESVNKERKSAQEGIRAEMDALEETWRKGVGRILEVEVATELLRRQTLEARRQAAR